jgi:hypothetical protein
MNILFIIKVNILCSLSDHISPLPTCWLLNLGWLEYFEHLIQSHLSNMSFWLFVHRSTPSHIPLKCWSLVYCYVGFRHVHLMAPNFITEGFYVFWPLARSVQILPSQPLVGPPCSQTCWRNMLCPGKIYDQLRCMFFSVTFLNHTLY